MSRELFSVSQMKVSSESVVENILRRIHTKYSSEKKILIVLEGIRGAESIATLCHREGMPANLYYR
jgi:transposase